MRRIITVIFFIAISMNTVCASQAVCFSDFWRFYRGDVSGAQATSFIDDSWDTAYLPHTVRLESVGTTAPYSGYCWYRKTFTPNAARKIG
jgi:beta-galactosidase